MQVIVLKKSGRKLKTSTAVAHRNASSCRMIAIWGGAKINPHTPAGGAKGGVGKGRIVHGERIHPIK